MLADLIPDVDLNLALGLALTAHQHGHEWSKTYHFLTPHARARSMGSVWAEGVR